MMMPEMYGAGARKLKKVLQAAPMAQKNKPMTQARRVSATQLSAFPPTVRHSRSISSSPGMSGSSMFDTEARTSAYGLSSSIMSNSRPA